MISNLTSEVVFNENFHILENVSLDELSMGVNIPAPSAQLMVLHVFFVLIVETIGNFLLLSMIIYEKYGMDSQKRTLTNRLLSSICVSFLAHNVIAVPLFMFHQMYRYILITKCKIQLNWGFWGLVKEVNYLSSNCHYNIYRNKVQKLM